MSRWHSVAASTPRGAVAPSSLWVVLVALWFSSAACRPSDAPPASVGAKSRPKAAPAPVRPRPVKVDKAPASSPKREEKKTVETPPVTPVDPIPPKVDAEPKPTVVTETTPDAALPTLPTPGDKVREPVVLLSAYHLATCVVGMGDRFPDFQLPDDQGHLHSSADILNKPLTVVVLWNSESPQGVEQFQRLQRDIVKGYGPSGIGVVAVNVGDEPQSVTSLAAEAGATFPVLLDPRRELFAKVAKSRLPRTYLLDHEGRILWFDLEYSRSSRREMLNAIHYHFDKAKL